MLLVTVKEAPENVKFKSHPDQEIRHHTDIARHYWIGATTKGKSVTDKVVLVAGDIRANSNQPRSKAKIRGHLARTTNHLQAPIIVTFCLLQ